MVRTEQANAGRVCGHIAYAERPRGGVLVLPTITGVDAPMRERARLLAEAGFTAMVWDPYPGEAPPADMPAAQARAAKLNDGAIDSMVDCVSHLLGPLKLPVAATLGFCLGGRYALLLTARDKRLAACVPYYPSVRIPMSPNQTLDAVVAARDIACPVHMVHAGSDQVFLPAAFAKVREALEQRAAATVVQVHPGAVHSFMRPDLQAAPANALASALSWPPVLAFLEACTGRREATAARAVA
jgi:carboxymethylenebutenolidase